ncbi:hypothetical protein O9Z70_08055 [Devosia sp. YIM 151766]|uniref:hypothetical protein n=1 Tax=Devosia sp. YIM 151766 TaxID=3017325 RepID=UPI00255C3D1A|nr:hypothetical protein [Devosia sp. YIM 151766]WIY51449.1 hypothetical protein O9Z70_08055 [Devosia sp. YIM 151766]
MNLARTESSAQGGPLFDDTGWNVAPTVSTAITTGLSAKSRDFPSSSYFPGRFLQKAL